MKNYLSGHPVSRGAYLDLNPIDLQLVGADGECLDGLEGGNYLRIPTLFALAASPLLGGLFVVLFPVLVFGSVIALVGETAARALGSLARQQAPLLRMQGAPAASYLNREPAGEERRTEDDLMALEEEVRIAREAEDRQLS